MTTDFEKLVSEWDSMFLTTIDRTRDRRTEAILGTLGTGCQPPFRVLDLGSGPGPLAGRILQRFSGSRVVGVDSDPSSSESERKPRRDTDLAPGG